MSSPSDLPILAENLSSPSIQPSLVVDDQAVSSSIETKKPKSYKNILAVGILIVLAIGIFFVIRHKFSNFKKTMPNKKDVSDKTLDEMK